MILKMHVLNPSILYKPFLNRELLNEYLADHETRLNAANQMVHCLQNKISN